MEHGSHRVEADDSGFRVFWPSGPKSYSSARRTIIALVNGVEDPDRHCKDPKVTFDNYFRLNKGFSRDLSISDVIRVVRSDSKSLSTSVPEVEIKNDYSLSVERRRGIDLSENYRDVKRLFYAGFSKRVFAMGYDPEEVFQELCKGILIRNNGKCVFDPEKSSLGHYVHMVTNCIISNYNRKHSRIRRTESVGYMGEDGEVVDLSSVDIPVEAEQLSALSAHDIVNSVNRSVPRQMGQYGRDKVSLAVKMITEGRGRSEIVEATGLTVGAVSKIIKAVREMARP